ncbi:hypothetical protein FHS21_002799 [Phyllobacterium trifolii]|uniref:Uncharacterized protein n=1 Tax=Phyllobacterium trifolii TaxID=300193 RepID=A0A839U8T6_9HYPH|nr:hypothetical protein [Phyllobacterium trifolii]
MAIVDAPSGVQELIAEIPEVRTVKRRREKTQ